MDVNTLGAVIRTIPAGVLSNLVQRESLGRPTCMPIYFIFGFKNGDMAAILFFDLHDNTVLAYISKIVLDRVLVTIIHI